MTLSEILSNEELRQHEFPVTREKIFLAHAGVCPLPRRVVEAMEKYARDCSLGDQEEVLPIQLTRETRERAAGLIGATAEEIALVGPTSLALSYVAAGLTFRKNDNVVVYFDDYPSNVYPWMALADRGVEVRFLNIREYGRIRTVDVKGQVDEQTRLVALASCHFVAGYRIDVRGIGEYLQQRGILFCVDGIQTVGAFPTPTSHVDFLAADSHKWLLGPCAAGIFYVRRSVQEQLHPSTYGWHNVKCPSFVAQEEMKFRLDASRYEAGSPNFLGLVGLHAALGLIAEIGPDNIAAELLRKRALLVPALKEKGYSVLQAEAGPENASGIVTLFKPDADMGALHQKLTEAKITTSLRTDRNGQRYIRLSPHFYNTDAELHRVLELL